MNMCLRHFFRPDQPLMVKGAGNCVICKPDRNNKFCSMYHKIKVNILEVEVKEQED